MFEGEYFDYLTVHEPEYLAALALIGGSSPGHNVSACEVPKPGDAQGVPVLAAAILDGTPGGAGAINLLPEGSCPHSSLRRSHASRRPAVFHSTCSVPLDIAFAHVPFHAKRTLCAHSEAAQHRPNASFSKQH